MGWTGEEIRALNEKRKAKMEAQAREHQAKIEAQAREHQARQQEPAPTAPAPAGVTLTEADRHRIYEEEKAKREPPQGAPAAPPAAVPQPPAL